jgi:outer membrane protein
MKGEHDKPKLAAFLGCAAVALLGGAAAAQEAAPEPAWKVSLGAGALFKPDYEGSDEYEVDPLPDISISYRDLVFLRGTTLSANLLTMNVLRPDGILQVGPLVRYRFGRDQDDNEALRGLGDVDGSVEAGVFARYRVGLWSTGLSLVQDIAGGHEGMLGEAFISQDVPLSERLRASLRGSVTWASDDYMNSYFGISPAQAARSGRAPFDADSGFKDIGLSLGLEYSLSAGWSVGGRIGYIRLLNDAADSPLVDEDGSANQFTAGVSLSYRF